jgi:hypothetical protein
LERAFPKDFNVDRTLTKVLNYSISSKLSQDHFSKKARYLSVRVGDVARHGELEAVLIRNLEFKTRPENVRKPVTDELGRIYGEMSAVALTTPRESREGDNKAKVAVLPFQRRAVQGGISNLKSKGLFVEHGKRRGFYTLNRDRFGDENGSRNGKNQECSNATVECTNATVVCSDATDLCPNATVSSVQIERERNVYRNKIESDNKTSSISPLAQPAEASLAFEHPNLELLNLDESGFEVLRNPLIEVLPDPSIPSIQSSLDSTPVQLPLFFSDEFPDLIVELNDRVQKLQNARKTPIEHVNPDDRPSTTQRPRMPFSGLRMSYS